MVGVELVLSLGSMLSCVGEGGGVVECMLLLVVWRWAAEGVAGMGGIVVMCRG